MSINYKYCKFQNIDSTPHFQNSPKNSLLFDIPQGLVSNFIKQTTQSSKSVISSRFCKSKASPKSYSVSASPGHDHGAPLTKTAFLHSLLAGAIAGTNEHLLMHPFDTIKTRMQADTGTKTPRYRSTIHAFNTMLTKEGPMSFWRGAIAVSLGAAPSHALYFGAYEFFKQTFHDSMESHSHIANGLAGASATIIQDFTMNPFDVVKQRMQLKKYPSLTKCVQQTIKMEGVASLWRSYPTTLAMNVPFYAAYTSSYELCKELLHEHFSIDPETFSLPIDFFSGGLAGGIAALITNPLDVTKTRLQLGSMVISESGEVTLRGKHSYTGLWPTLSALYQSEGIASFWRGVTPRLISNVPSAAICWTTYEGCKFFLSHASDDFQH